MAVAVAVEKTSTLNFPKIFLPFLEPATYKIAYGGRGSAKSESVAGLLVYLGTLSPCRILCCREFQASLRDSSKSMIEKKIKEQGLELFYKITDDDIVGLNGTIFIFKGLRLNVGALNSLADIDHCWIEEAQTVSTLSMDAILRTIRKKTATVWMTFNPRKATDPAYSMFVGGTPPPNSIVLKVNYVDNPWFYETNLPSLMEWDKKRDLSKYKHIWLGELQKHSNAIVFDNWKIGKIDVPDGTRAYYGLDYGYSIDPTVLIRCFLLDPKVLYIDKEAYGHKIEIDNLQGLFDKIPGSQFGNIVADNARPELNSHLKKLKYRITPSVKGRNSIVEGIEFIRNHDVVIHPDCTFTIAEFEDLSWFVDEQENITSKLAQGQKDHCVDAIRYAIEAARRSTLTISLRDIRG